MDIIIKFNLKIMILSASGSAESTIFLGYMDKWIL